MANTAAEDGGVAVETGKEGSRRGAEVDPSVLLGGQQIDFADSQVLLILNTFHRFREVDTVAQRSVLVGSPWALPFLRSPSRPPPPPSPLASASSILVLLLLRHLLLLPALPAGATPACLSAPPNLMFWGSCPRAKAALVLIFPENSRSILHARRLTGRGSGSGVAAQVTAPRWRTNRCTAMPARCG